MRGLQGRDALSVAIASSSARPRHQNMYASAVAGARPRPALISNSDVKLQLKNQMCSNAPAMMRPADRCRARM